MACQLKTEPLEFLHLQTVQQVRDSEGLLYNIGYRGPFTTMSDSARLDVQLPEHIDVHVTVGSVIVYRANPPTVVDCCATFEDFDARYDHD